MYLPLHSYQWYTESHFAWLSAEVLSKAATHVSSLSEIRRCLDDKAAALLAWTRRQTDPGLRRGPRLYTRTRVCLVPYTFYIYRAETPGHPGNFWLIIVRAKYSSPAPGSLVVTLTSGPGHEATEKWEGGGGETRGQVESGQHSNPRSDRWLIFLLTYIYCA